MSPPPTRRARAIRATLVPLLAVAGPGIIAGLADDDPAGITTYSVMGSTYGTQLLWLVVLSTAALVLFQVLTARLGAVTGQGLVGLARQRFGPRTSILAIGALIIANTGTTAAEFAGVAAGSELFGVPRWISVPIAAALVSLLVLRGGFRGVERVLLALSSVFACYLVAAVLAGPDWTATLRGAVIPSMPLTQDAFVIAAACIGTTLTPWGLAFVQSYVVDKRLSTRDLHLIGVDMTIGAILTGVIACCVVITCAATLHPAGVVIDSAAAAASALEPLAGPSASVIFAVGLIGAALLAASILPLSTAYAVGDLTGRPADLDDPVRQAPLFYGTFILVTAVGVGLVLAPSVPLIDVLVLTQVVNAVLLLPILWLVLRLSRDQLLMGQHTASRTLQTASTIVTLLVGLCVVGLAVATLVG